MNLAKTHLKTIENTEKNFINILQIIQRTK